MFYDRMIPPKEQTEHYDTTEGGIDPASGTLDGTKDRVGRSTCADAAICEKLALEPQLGIRLIYERYAFSLLRFVFRFTECQETAEEILHDIFLDLLGGKFRLQDSGQSEGQLKAWLFTVAKNKSLNFKKKKSREILNEAAVNEASSKENIEENIVEFQLRQQFNRIEENLPESLKRPWLLRREGKDNQQIATELNIPVGTVKSRFFRLVEIFKEELEPHEN